MSSSSSTSTTIVDPSLPLLSRLVDHVLDNNDPPTHARLLRYTLRLLSSGLGAHPPHPRDPALDLARAGQVDAARRFELARERLTRLVRHPEHTVRFLSALTNSSSAQGNTHLGNFINGNGRTTAVKVQVAPSPTPSPPTSTPTTPTTPSPTPSSQLLRDVLFALQNLPNALVNYPALVAPGANTAPVEEVALRAGEAGWLYAQAARAASAETATQDGLVAQAFYAAVRDELAEYSSLVVALRGAPGLTLRRLLVWLEEPLVRLRLVWLLCGCARGLKGGALARAVERHQDHGDPAVRALVRRVTEKLAEPIHSMSRRWMERGEVEDPHHEFFVSVDMSVKVDQLWAHRYSVREAMLPSFLGPTVAANVLRIGRAINFLKHCCGEDAGPGPLLTLEAADARVMAVMMGRYGLMKHVTALRNYLLMGHGDFVLCLLDQVGPELGKPAAKVHRHVVAGLVEAAVRASNAQYDDPEVVSRLDVRLLEASPGDVGWDVFTLDYRVEPPLSTVLTRPAMTSYLAVFHFLLKLRRVEQALSGAWLRAMGGGAGTAVHLLRAKMSHLVTNLQHFVMFEALESSWHELTRAVERAADLDGVIAAHNAYVEAIKARALLNEARLQAGLERLFALVYRLEGVAGEVRALDQAFDEAFEEVLEYLGNGGEAMQSVAFRLDYSGWWEGRKNKN